MQLSRCTNSSQGKGGTGWWKNWHTTKGTYFRIFEKPFVNFTQKLFCILAIIIHNGYHLPLWIQWFLLEQRTRDSCKAKRSDWLLTRCQTPWLHALTKVMRCKVSLESWEHQPQVKVIQWILFCFLFTLPLPALGLSSETHLTFMKQGNWTNRLKLWLLQHILAEHLLRQAFKHHSCPAKMGTAKVCPLAPWPDDMQSSIPLSLISVSLQNRLVMTIHSHHQEGCLSCATTGLFCTVQSCSRDLV